MAHFLQNGRRRGRPDEWLGVAVMVRHVFLDGANQLGETPEGPPSDPLARDLGEPAFDEV
jgi:hypothetical protein